MNLVILYDASGAERKRYLLPESRLALLVDYLKAVKMEDFNGTWGPNEQALFAGFSDVIVKDGT